LCRAAFEPGIVDFLGADERGVSRRFSAMQARVSVQLKIDQGRFLGLRDP
jgi:hypothetical protein